MTEHHLASPALFEMTESDAVIALGAFDPCVTLLDVMHRVIRWSSPAFEKQFGLSAGDSLAQLNERLPAAQAALDQLLSGAHLSSTERVAPAAGLKSSRKTEPSATALEPGPMYTVTVKLVRPGLAVLKAQPVDDRADEAMRRHLQDRERLLFTSRRLSVSEMASTLAHELNQPIGTVTNVLRGMKNRLDAAQSGGEGAVAMVAPEALAVGVRLALDQATFAARIIARIRSFTQSRQPQGVRLNLCKVLQDSAALLDWEVDRHNVKVRWDLAQTDCDVVGDEVMLQQVMVNLLRNALEAMQEVNDRPRLLIIRLRLQDDGKYAEVGIRDNGCGMPQDAAQPLFVPFQSTKPNGMGIGLNICRSFIELHQGRLWCTSNHSDSVPGSGVTFHWTLPVCPKSTSARSTPAVSASRLASEITPPPSLQERIHDTPHLHR